MKTLKTKFGDITLEVFNYMTNGRLAILGYLPDGELYGDITTNIPYPLNDIGETFINSTTNDCSPELVKQMKDIGLIEKTYGFRSCGYGNYELVKFNLDKLKEFDKEGVEKFLNYFEEPDMCTPEINI